MCLANDLLPSPCKVPFVQREDRLLRSESETISFPPSPFPPLTSRQMMHENEGKAATKEETKTQSKSLSYKSFYSGGAKQSDEENFSDAGNLTKRQKDYGNQSSFICLIWEKSASDIFSIVSENLKASWDALQRLMPQQRQHISGRACTKIEWSIEVRTSKHVFYHNSHREQIIIHHPGASTLKHRNDNFFNLVSISSSFLAGFYLWEIQEITFSTDFDFLWKLSARACRRLKTIWYRGEVSFRGKQKNIRKFEIEFGFVIPVNCGADEKSTDIVKNVFSDELSKSCRFNNFWVK